MVIVVSLVSPNTPPPIVLTPSGRVIAGKAEPSNALGPILRLSTPFGKVTVVRAGSLLNALKPIVISVLGRLIVVRFEWLSDELLKRNAPVEIAVIPSPMTKWWIRLALLAHGRGCHA
jgi:hypothetical protein